MGADATKWGFGKKAEETPTEKAETGRQGHDSGKHGHGQTQNHAQEEKPKEETEEKTQEKKGEEYRLQEKEN